MEYQLLNYPHKGTNNVASEKSLSSAAAASLNKKRMRWTQDLHRQFVDCVNHLGGAEKATPKAVLKMMNVKELTILNIKSHLQKYRMARYMPQAESSEEKSERSIGKDAGAQLNPRPCPVEEDKAQLIYSNIGMQIAEAIKLQLDVQRHLLEQLEVQKVLQQRIEEQGRQLQNMLNHQQKTYEILSYDPYNFQIL